VTHSAGAAGSAAAAAAAVSAGAVGVDSPFLGDGHSMAGPDGTRLRPRKGAGQLSLGMKKSLKIE
jgi:hypothetical protein